MDTNTNERRDEKTTDDRFTFDGDQTWRTNDDADATWPTRPRTREEPLE